MKYAAKIVFAITVAIAVAMPMLAAADEASRVNNEAEIRLTIEAEHAYASDVCTATMEMEYYQKGASVHVETSLDNEQCAASFGTYTLAIRYCDADGNLQSKVVEESWERVDGAPVQQAKDYFVADDIDIVRVRPRKLRCTCATDEGKPDEPELID